MGSWTKRLTCLSLVAGLAVLPLSRHGELAAQTRRADAKASDAVLVTAVRGVEVVVSDLNRSRAFFELLGFTVLGEEELSEHLNGVFGARLRITALRAGSGPGIELLEYLSPRGGRAAPSDARPNDLTHWQIDVEAPKTTAVWSAANDGGARGVTQTSSAHEALVRDRDGHALLVTEIASGQ